MFFDIVMAMDESGGIGRQGSIPWRNSEEMAFFKALTSRTEDPDKMNAVLMGKRTWESIPNKYRPLPNRVNGIISKSFADSFSDSPLGYHTLNEALEDMGTPRSGEYDIETIFVIGGAQLYNEALVHPDCRFVIVSMIKGSHDCDTFVKIPQSFSSIEKMVLPSFTIHWLVRTGDIE